MSVYQTFYNQLINKFKQEVDCDCSTINIISDIVDRTMDECGIKELIVNAVKNKEIERDRVDSTKTKKTKHRANGYTHFVQEETKRRKDKNKKHDMATVIECWKLLSDRDKQLYKDQAIEINNS